MTLKSFLVALQKHEGFKNIDTLVHPWPLSLRKKIISKLRKINTIQQGSRISTLKTAKFSNQSKGSSIEKYLKSVLILASDKEVKFEVCKGAGYPDMYITFPMLPDLMVFLEIKATTIFNSKDGNRRVLFSSTQKMRKYKNAMSSKHCFHLLLTCEYDEKSKIINSIRFDFLEPNTSLNIRLEASTSHKLLSSGSQSNIVFN